jgi:hypothetical protein
MFDADTEISARPLDPDRAHYLSITDSPSLPLIGNLGLLTQPIEEGDSTPWDEAEASQVTVPLLAVYEAATRVSLTSTIVLWSDHHPYYQGPS